MIRRCLSFLLQAWGALSLLALAVLCVLLLTAGWWLKAEDEPRPADAIVILAGDPRRAPHAADLYLQGLAPVIYIGRPLHDPPKVLCALGLPCPREEELMRFVMTAKGVPDQAVRFYGQELMSTVDEIEHLARTLSPEQKTLLVVTSPSHSRRTKLILSRLLPGRELLMSPTADVRFEREWWTHPESAKAVVTELAKFAFSLLGQPFRSQTPDAPGQRQEAGEMDPSSQPEQSVRTEQSNQTNL